MKFLAGILAVVALITLTACKNSVLRANFNDKSDGDLIGPGPGIEIYFPSESPDGDLVRATRLSTDNHRFTSALAINDDFVSLMLIPTTQSELDNPALDFRSIKVASNLKKYTFAWSGLKKGDLELNCRFGTQRIAPPGLSDAISVRFANGKAFVSAGDSGLTDLGSLPNNVEHRIYMSVDAEKKSYYLSITNPESPGLSHSDSFSSTIFDVVDYTRAECQYVTSAVEGSNYYIFDKMDFQARKK